MTCRCSMCGGNNGSHKSKNRGLYIRFGIGRNENDRPISANGKKGERKLLRKKLKNLDQKWNLEY